jgi:hypothetical protein
MMTLLIGVAAVSWNTSESVVLGLGLLWAFAKSLPSPGLIQEPG